jgi:DNA invertase Pin-like site-specific DNA recombinase
LPISEAFRSAGDPTIGRELITQGRLLATMLAGIANFERGLIRERTGASRKRAAIIWTRFSIGLNRNNL